MNLHKQVTERRKLVPLLLGMVLALLLMDPVWAQENSGTDEARFVPLGWYANANSSSNLAFNKTTDVNFDNILLEQALEELARQVKVRLAYDKGQLPEKKVSVSAENISVISAFKRLVKNTNLNVLASPSGQIVIKNKTAEKTAAAVETVSGTVTDSENGETLPGVNISVKGTTVGTSSNEQGQYTLNVPSLSDTLMFSFIGYRTAEVPINGRTTIDIAMQPQAIEGEELVVVGYGTRRKTDVTNAISSVSGEQVAETGSVSPMQALQGQIAGADITRNSGQPGSGFNIQIRGQNSLVGGDPLYVVDGTIVNDINFLNPQQIEKIDVLKDASATAIYGSRGSNGVVIVTTKGGSGSVQTGETSITYNAHYGIRSRARMPDFMTGDEWWNFRRFGFVSYYHQGGINDLQLTDLYNQNSEVLNQRLENKEYTNWTDLVLRDGAQQNHYISVAGSPNETVSYNIGVGYQNEKGNVLGESYDRYNLKASLDSDIGESWRAGVNLNLSFSDRQLASDYATLTSYGMSPLLAPYDSTGSLLFKPGKYGGIGWTSTVNPLWELQDYEHEMQTTRGIGSVYLEFSPLDWLGITSTFSPQFQIERDGEYFGPHTSQRQLRDGSASMAYSQGLSYIWDNKISAIQDFGEHHFDLLGLFSIEMDRYEGESSQVANLPYESLFYNLGSADDFQSTDSYYQKTSLMSFMLRLNYTYNDKYLVTVANRLDGSSVLAPGHKWAMFPSASLGWRISEESFIQNIDAISDLKLRLSYGISGNNNINPYTTQVLANTQLLYDFGGELAKGFAPSGIVNKELTWETSREYDVGLDYGFLDGRITGSVDFYNKLSRKLLMSRQLPYETGSEAVTDNIGSVKNEGIELALNTVNILTNNFSWQTTFNFATNRNEIVELYGGKEDDLGNAWFIGEPVNVNYAYEFDGIWHADQDYQTYGQDEGQVRVKDLNNDDQISSDDKKILGSPSPSWTGGFTTQFNYKGFDLSATIFARQGVQVYSSFHSLFADMDDIGRQKLDVNYYAPENSLNSEELSARNSNSYPEPYNSGPYQDALYYMDASFVKVQNIRAGYTLPSRLTSKVGVQNFRVYVNITSPFVFTNYNGFDPEWASQGWYNGAQNSFRTYQVGLNLKF